MKNTFSESKKIINKPSKDTLILNHLKEKKDRILKNKLLTETERSELLKKIHQEIESIENKVSLDSKSRRQLNQSLANKSASKPSKFENILKPAKRALSIALISIIGSFNPSLAAGTNSTVQIQNNHAQALKQSTTQKDFESNFKQKITSPDSQRPTTLEIIYNTVEKDNTITRDNLAELFNQALLANFKTTENPQTDLNTKIADTALSISNYFTDNNNSQITHAEFMLKIQNPNTAKFITKKLNMYFGKDVTVLSKYWTSLLDPNNSTKVGQINENFKKQGKDPEKYKQNNPSYLQMVESRNESKGDNANVVWTATLFLISTALQSLAKRFSANKSTQYIRPTPTPGNLSRRSQNL